MIDSRAIMALFFLWEMNCPVLMRRSRTNDAWECWAMGDVAFGETREQAIEALARRFGWRE